MSWRDEALCAGWSVSLFFPEQNQPPAPEALSACSRCPVARLCLEEALRYPEEEDYGIRGGLTEQQRRLIRRLDHEAT